jgi:hypothetical protein
MYVEERREVVVAPGGVEVKRRPMNDVREVGEDVRRWGVPRVKLRAHKRHVKGSLSGRESKDKRLSRRERDSPRAEALT